ncbi:hypothetical protein AQUCO_00200632v1 [Aquilegia coerulea]|uniref:Uncharacterized protein n=1 Tax=Aquilegia coerulea TaxID=218851 RepID=A0A2G5F3Z6_AQUCA|nr:hypothetical protein AQUCO_00200632v1 [Aquilegia coerulea]
MAAATSLHLLLILLFCSHQIISMSAVPISRSKNLLHETKAQDLVASKNFHQGITEEAWEEELTINDRMELESSTNDYPGSGPNNRHIPRPPLGRN